MKSRSVHQHVLIGCREKDAESYKPGNYSIVNYPATLREGKDRKSQEIGDHRLPVGEEVKVEEVEWDGEHMRAKISREGKGEPHTGWISICGPFKDEIREWARPLGI